MDLVGEVSFAPVQVVVGMDGDYDLVSRKLGERVAAVSQDGNVAADGAVSPTARTEGRMTLASLTLRDPA